MPSLFRISLCLGLLLQALPARAANPELVCDPDAKVKFQSTWLSGNTVVLEREGLPSLSLPWEGLGRLVSGRQLKDSVPGEALEAVEDGASFLAFPSKNPAVRLYIQRDLLRGLLPTGLVLAQGAPERTPSSPGNAFTLYHCSKR